MKQRKALFSLEALLLLLAAAGKIAYTLAFRGADEFSAYPAHRVLWEVEVLTPALFFLLGAVPALAVTRPWRRPARTLGRALCILLLVLFLAYYPVLLLWRGGSLAALDRTMMDLMQTPWVFLLLGELHGLAPTVGAAAP